MTDAFVEAAMPVEARSELQQYLRLRPGDARAALTGADVMASLGEYEQARSYMADAVQGLEMNPANTLTMLLVRLRHEELGLWSAIQDNELQGRPVEVGASGRYLPISIDVQLARRELRSGSSRAAVRSADQAAKVAQRLGFGGVMCEALEVQAAALVQSRRKRKANSLRSKAIDQATALGRIVQVARLQQLGL